MSGAWPRLALIVAPVPFTLVSETADWIASAVLLLFLGVVVAGWIVGYIVGEIALGRECDRPFQVAGPVEAKR
jgi:uncharacterized membrane protein